MCIRICNGNCICHGTAFNNIQWNGKLFHGMSDCIVGIMSLDACHQIFSVALSHVRCLIVGIKHLAGYKLRSAKICFLQCPLDIGFVCPDIVEECSEDRQLQQCLFDRGILVRCAVKAAHRRRIDRRKKDEEKKIVVQGDFFKNLLSILDEMGMSEEDVQKVNVYLTDMKNLYIDDLCVDENMRDKHVGTVIYDYVKKYAKEIGCYNLTLNVWSCNESAQKFYEKQGLKPQKTTMEMIL